MRLRGISWRSPSLASLGLAAALLLAAPGAARADQPRHDRHEHRHGAACDRDHRGHGVQWHHHDQGRHFDARRFVPPSYVHWVRGRPVVIVQHGPFYCARCRHDFAHAAAFHQHLSRSHGIALHSVWGHLFRDPWGWVFPG